MKNLDTNNNEVPESPSTLTVTVDPGLIGYLMEEWGESSDTVEQTIAGDFKEMVEKYYGYQV